MLKCRKTKQLLTVILASVMRKTFFQEQCKSTTALIKTTSSLKSLGTCGCIYVNQFDIHACYTCLLSLCHITLNYNSGCFCLQLQHNYCFLMTFMAFIHKATHSHIVISLTLLNPLVVAALMSTPSSHPLSLNIGYFYHVVGCYLQQIICRKAGDKVVEAHRV